MTREEALEYVNNMWMYEDTKNALETLIPEFGKAGSDKVIDHEDKYKEALLEARAVLEPCLKYSNGKVREALDSIDKELKSFESEDERIRKWLVNHFRQLSCQEVGGIAVDDIIAYLEKQKENPKSADSIPSDCTSLAKCEDRDSKYGVFPEDVLVVARACEKLEAHGYPELAYALKNVNLYTKPVDYDHEMWKNCEANFEGGKKEVIDHPERYGLTKQKPVEKPDLVAELKHHLATTPKEQLEKEWKELEHWNNIGPTVQEFLYGKPVEWSEEDRLHYVNVLEALEFVKGCKSDYDKIEAVISDIAWLKSLRPQKLDVSKLENYDPVEVLNRIKTEWPMAWEKVVGKQEWSEEDEKTIDDAYCWLCEYAGSLIQKNFGKSSMLYGIANKLKSLRPQPKQEWSEEDKRKLNRIYEILGQAADEKPFGSSKRIIGDKEAVELQDFIKSLRPQQNCNYCKEHEIGYRRGLKQAGWNKEFIEEVWTYLNMYRNLLDGTDKQDLSNSVLKACDKLKSLRSSWKPSEEQMKALQNAVALTACDKELARLYNQLKKL